MKDTEPDIRKIGAELAEILGADRCVLVGALAVAVHGYVRATDDVDLLTDLDLSEAQRVLRAKGIDTVMRRGDVLDGGFPCLTGSIHGVRFDILPPLVPIRWDHAVRLSIGSARLAIVDLDGLLRLKLRAGGPQDLMDTAHLLMRHPDQIAATRETARAYRIEDKLEVWLKDSRVRSAVEDELRDQGEDGRRILARLEKVLPAPRRSRKRRRST